MANLPTRSNCRSQLTTRQLGARYEQRARSWLEERGFLFIAANVHCRGGELDLIMRQRQTLVFVEVRYRHNDVFGDALASISSAKRRKLIFAARYWLAQQNGKFDTVDCRFDVVAFTGGKLAWVPNAFTVED